MAADKPKTLGSDKHVSNDHREVDVGFIGNGVNLVVPNLTTANYEKLNKIRWVKIMRSNESKITKSCNVNLRPRFLIKSGN